MREQLLNYSHLIVVKLFVDVLDLRDTFLLKTLLFKNTRCNFFKKLEVGFKMQLFHGVNTLISTSTEPSIISCKIEKIHQVNETEL